MLQKRSDAVGKPCLLSFAPLVVQKGASNANGEAHVGARGHCPNLATWRFNWSSPTVSGRFRNTGSQLTGPRHFFGCGKSGKCLDKGGNRPSQCRAIEDQHILGNVAELYGGLALSSQIGLFLPKPT